MIYLDNAATTKISDEVLSEMLPYLTDLYGNAGAMYRLGLESNKAISLARERVARFIKCRPEQVVFTSGGTESNNMAMRGLVQRCVSQGKNHIITSSTEHDSILNLLSQLKKEYDISISYVFPDRNTGVITADAVERLITPETGLVSIMAVNNEMGTINEIEQIGKMLMEREILYHTDCVQAAGSIDIDVERFNCDFLSLSGHKIHAPKGVGAVYMRDFNISPLICGGASQENGMRGGTENVASIVAFGKACENQNLRLEESTDNYKKMRLVFEKTLTDELSKYGIKKIMTINNENFITCNKIVSVRFDNVDAQTLVLFADSKNLCISAGSACKNHENEPNQTLLAFGLNEKQSRETVRVSFSELLKEEDASDAAKIIAWCVNCITNNLNKRR